MLVALPSTRRQRLLSSSFAAVAKKLIEKRLAPDLKTQNSKSGVFHLKQPGTNLIVDQAVVLKGVMS